MSGHYCWCCAQYRANERFSGKNHGRHLCRDCARLPEAERVFRQAAIDIDRVLSKGGRLRKQRAPGEVLRLRR